MSKPTKGIKSDEEINLEDDFDWIENEAESESPELFKKSISLKRKTQKLNLINALKKEKAGDILKGLPKKEETLHIVSNGSYDFFSYIPIITDYMNIVSELYGSTWTMNRNNVIELFSLFDNKKIQKINILTGVYFKRRESAVYAELFMGIQKRKQRYKALENHTKIIMLSDNTNYIVIEGSANFTSNPRIEQYIINNNKELYDFHKNWMDEALDDDKEHREYFRKR